MKNIKINLNLNNKNLLSNYFKINESIDLSLLNDVKNITKIFNEAKYKEIKKALCELDIFKYIAIDLFKQDYVFEIEITTISNNPNTYRIFSKAFRYYNNEIYFSNDLYFYENKIYVKQEFLLNTKFDNLQYNFKPKYDYLQSNVIYYGFELEISCGSLNNYNLLYRSLIDKDLLKDNKIILKDDGSIQGENTVEIVTAPLSRIELNKIINELNIIFKKFENGARGHNVGGMHIHCSLAPINSKSILNLLRFMFNTNNISSFYKVAQRTCERFADFDMKRVINQQDLLDFVAGDNKKIKNSDRYSAINFTDNTIEFRIFNSSLRKERLLKNLDFVEATIQFIKSKNFSKDFQDFKNFLQNSKKYKYLKEFIKYMNEE